jgi:hypothetical protein
MPTFTSKARLVTFRLTQCEYESIKNLCLENGVRSISEFARVAVVKEISRQGRGNVSFTDDLGTLMLRLQDIDSAAKDICQRIAKFLGSEVTGGK